MEASGAGESVFVDLLDSYDGRRRMPSDAFLLDVAARLHPADAFAWVAERKDVLSTLFWLLTILLGLLIMEFPGKWWLEHKVAGHPLVMRLLNWIRRKGHKEPLEPPAI